MIATPKLPKGSTLLGEVLVDAHGGFRIYDDASGIEIEVKPDGSMVGLEDLSQEDAARFMDMLEHVSAFLNKQVRTGLN